MSKKGHNIIQLFRFDKGFRYLSDQNLPCCLQFFFNYQGKSTYNLMFFDS